MALFAGLVALPAAAQQVSAVSCQGTFMGYEAVVQGQRTYAPYNALGDAEVGFNGIIETPVGRGRMVYGGYTATAPFSGVIDSPQGHWQISVLDATGANGTEMIIYGGAPSLGPPTTLGQLICR